MSDFENKNLENNGADYKDSYYQCKCPHGQYRTAIVFSWTCVILALVTQIVCGCIGAALTAEILYTCIHFVLCLLAYGSLISLLFKLTKGGKTILCSVYDSVMARIPVRTIIAILISLGGIIYESLFAFIFRKGHDLWAVILCIVLHLFAVFATFAARLSITGLPFKGDK